jgi:ABC-type phosphonate transport system ATPase subunit
MTFEPATVTLEARPGEFALVATHLSKRFGSRVAFDDVSFEVGYGDVFGFLGPNGRARGLPSPAVARSAAFCGPVAPRAA